MTRRPSRPSPLVHPLLPSSGPVSSRRHRGVVAVSLCALVIGLGAVVGCADRASAPYPTSGPPPAEDAALGPGDVFEVRVHREAELSNTYQVSVEGTIEFPLIGTVAVDGKTPVEIEREITTRLLDGYLKRPQVSVFVKEYRSKRVSVIGQVKQPGTFPFTENMSIVEAITKAGGFTPLARKNSVRVTRRAGQKRQTIIVAVDDIGRGKAPNFVLRPGDSVYVEEKIF